LGPRRRRVPRSGRRFHRLIQSCRSRAPRRPLGNEFAHLIVVEIRPPSDQRERTGGPRARCSPANGAVAAARDPRGEQPPNPGRVLGSRAACAACVSTGSLQTRMWKLGSRAPRTPHDPKARPYEVPDVCASARLRSLGGAARIAPRQRATDRRETAGRAARRDVDSRGPGRSISQTVSALRASTARVRA
jgi:hypothetical protein